MNRFEHLDALTAGLAREKSRLESASSDTERALRKVWVAQLEEEIDQERCFLGFDDITQLSDEDLLAALGE